MARFVLIDGNSIMNRAFYGIMGNKMLTTADGTYTNAIYGFLSILFKMKDEIKPDYMAVAFDLKGPTKRHKMYENYKANRHGMPEELAVQMPIIKDILKAMNIPIIEKEGYEGDDILGTLSKIAQDRKIDVTILSGDRDTFQLASEQVTIRIPRTKMGKTEYEDYTIDRIRQEYGIEPKQFIEVKGLMGDSSDNIPGVPGIGEKTALQLVQRYFSIENLYHEMEKTEDLPDIKGKTKEKLIENKDSAFLSKQLGTIDQNVPLEETIEDLKVQNWKKEEVLHLFQYLRFQRFIERFALEQGMADIKEKENDFLCKDLMTEKEIHLFLEKVKKDGKMIYDIETTKEEKSIIHQTIKEVYIYDKQENCVCRILANHLEMLKDVLENPLIKKIGYQLKKDDILLKENWIELAGIHYDVEVAAYILNPTESKYSLETLAMDYLQMDISCNLNREKQINLFDEKTEEDSNNKKFILAYTIAKLYEATEKKLKQTNQLELFYRIEMPLVEVLACMQYNGIYVHKEELIAYGSLLKKEIEKVTKNIYELAGEEFNINSTKQLGGILFEKLGLPVIKKTKNGYATDADVLEKLRKEHTIIDKILEYRQLMKLNSTYVEGLIPYINEKDQKIHSYFHQTVTATGRISSSDPNLQNIPTRFDLGKQIRRAFQPAEGNVFVDADYSQIELRILAHVAQDEHMIQAFQENKDIHKQTAAKVFGVPIEEVTSEQRSNAKAVNFGIVYGISDFGLSEQLGISRKQAKLYIDQYMEQYPKIKAFMEHIKKYATDNGYVETLFHRRRYIPEMNSNNYMVRQLGTRLAINTPIQGTAADIMKIAMITLYHSLKKNKLHAKIVLQIHDELLIEVKEEEKEEAKQLLKEAMENAMQLLVPLKVELTEAKDWYSVK